MNCPSRTDEVEAHPTWNQNPDALSNDLTTRQDFNGIANLRLSRDHLPLENTSKTKQENSKDSEAWYSETSGGGNALPVPSSIEAKSTARSSRYCLDKCYKNGLSLLRSPLETLAMHMKRFARGMAHLAAFAGPGFLVAVAYIDPGNYSTDVSAGAETRYKLLFVVLMSNIFAVVLQSLSIRLGTVTGRNLSEHCRAHLPKWLNLSIYVLAEVAIVATDMAEVIGSAIALNLLFKIPLVAGCAITLVDVLLILLFYTPDGSLSRLRVFECFVAALVVAVVACFCVQLSLLKDTSVGQVFDGYLPSSAVVDGQGIYLSCGVLGATVMPHSIFLGSGLVQPRLWHYDKVSFKENRRPSSQRVTKSDYQPSLGAIKHCLRYSTIELVISLTGFALFVNSAILIVAGSSLSANSAAQSADLFGVYSLLRSSIASAAGTIFAVALFFSGTAAGIVCTIAGQMVSEGHINWKLAPWLRRLLTRSISITPSIIIAATVGQNGLSAALNASQVVLSVILPFVSAPLIYFTCQNKYMTVNRAGLELGSQQEPATQTQGVSMRSHFLVSGLAILIWLVITVMNVSLLVFLGLGKS